MNYSIRNCSMYSDLLEDIVVVCLLRPRRSNAYDLRGLSQLKKIRKYTPLTSNFLYEYDG